MGNRNGKDKATLSEADLDFLVQQTGLPKSQIESNFANWKKNYPDGNLTKEEFRNMVEQCSWAQEADLVTVDNLNDRMFKMMDANQDGVVDFREFSFLLWVLSSGGADRNLEQIFQVRIGELFC